MATEALFYADSYLRDFEATVTAVSPDGVALDRSAFYPLGGGQPSDLGELRAHGQVWPVTAVRRRGRLHRAPARRRAAPGRNRNHRSP